MKRLLPITILLFPLVLTGCGKESDSLPADGRDFNAEAYIAGTPYTGRVIDDYLKNARVWLDMDGDGQPTTEPVTIRNQAGVELTLPGGEPTAMTVENGVFSLDVSELEQDPLVSADLDPRDYPLMAVAVPETTVQQRKEGDQVVAEAFMLSAPPGVRNVTPLTTLDHQRQVNNIGRFLVGTTELALALGNVNLVSDYVRSGDERAQAYARAFARFRASQLPQDYNDILRGGDGLARFLSAEAVNLMGISFARNALTIVQIVDEAAINGDYASVNVDSLDLPEIELELEDSVLVSGQTVFARSSDDLPTNFNGLDVLAELSFNYAENGRLKTVEANGCMTPSLTEMVRVINADGKIAATGTQWVPTVSLNQIGGTFYDEPGTDERLTFDWKNSNAAFETTTTCHEGLATSSELGGPAAIEYQWTLNNDGQVTSLTATSAGKTEVLMPDYLFSSSFFIGFTRTVNGVEEEVIDLVSEPQSCLATITEEDADKAQVVSAIQPFTLSGSLTIPSGFTNLGLELDTRERDGIKFNRPLRYGFLNEEFTDTEGVPNTRGFEWQFFYPTIASGEIVDDQPNLIGAAYLADYSGDKACGRDSGSIPMSSYARVEYSYQRLSEYLAGQVQ